jgi:hypothetical protein
MPVVAGAPRVAHTGKGNVDEIKLGDVTVTRVGEDARTTPA